MQQEFPISFRAQDGRLNYLDARTAQLLNRVLDFVHRRLVRRGVAHNSTSAHLFASYLKLGLHQQYELKAASSSAPTRTFQHRREHERGRDKRYIYGNEADGLPIAFWPKLLRRQVARVGFLQQTHAGMAAQHRIHLPITGINRKHLRGAVLQEAVGKAAGGSTDVEARQSLHREMPIHEGMGQLQAAATNKGRIIAKNAERYIGLDRCASFVNLLLVNQYPARKYQCLCSLSRESQPAFENQLVKPNLHAARLARRYC